MLLLEQNKLHWSKLNWSSCVQMEEEAAHNPLRPGNWSSWGGGGWGGLSMTRHGQGTGFVFRAGPHYVDLAGLKFTGIACTSLVLGLTA